MTNDSKADEDYSRNVGCCAMAAATWGRQHFPACVNGKRGNEAGGAS